MCKKLLLFVICVFSIACVYSQNKNLNQYKYVIVPNSYDFTNEPDQYQLNSLSKFLFNKYGFVAIMDDEPLPQEVINNVCLALYADVIKSPGIMKSKLRIQLKNCRKEIVFLSKEGESREKKYKVAYNLALRQAFESIKILNHKFEESSNVSNTNSQSNTSMIIETPVITENLDETESTNNKAALITEEGTDSQVLYAKPINNGYQLVDSTPKVIYVLIFSGKKDFYMVKGKDATVYKLNDNWVIAETVGDDLQVKTLNIKF